MVESLHYPPGSALPEHLLAASGYGLQENGRFKGPPSEEEPRSREHRIRMDQSKTLG